jgi:hypothetical protein
VTGTDTMVVAALEARHCNVVPMKVGTRKQEWASPNRRAA